LTVREKSQSVEWLAATISLLPSDDPVPRGTPGYNTYTTQKAHWLGWLNPAAGTGTYPRAGGADRDARDVYNRIVEPKLLLWLAVAAEVSPTRIDAARSEAEGKAKLNSKAAAIRKHVTWQVLVDALRKKFGARV
jgi:hypothetical protein